MEGVTILNQFEVVTKTVFSWQGFWGGFILGAVIAFIAAVIFGTSEEDWSAFLFGLIVFFIVVSPLLGVVSGYKLCPEPVEYETHYEVSIDENVNMQEFMDKYEIIETRGSIYTVREKCE